MAMAYLQVERVRELLVEMESPQNENNKNMLAAQQQQQQQQQRQQRQSRSSCSSQIESRDPRSFQLLHRDHFGDNLFHLVSHGNFGANLMYDLNQERYEQILLTLFRTLARPRLLQLFHEANRPHEPNLSDHKNVIGAYSDRPHYLIACWDYGLSFSRDLLTNYPYKPLAATLARLEDQYANEWKENKDKEEKEKASPIQRFVFLKPRRVTCPLTQQPIQHLAVLSDGTMFEEAAIRKHLQERNTNPVSAERLAGESASQLYKATDGTWTGKEVSFKVLYFPERDGQDGKGSFEHFDLV